MESVDSSIEEESKFSGKYAEARKLKEKKSKPLTLKKHLLNAILEPNEEPQQPTYVEEQAALRSEMVQAFKEAADEDEEDLLVPRERDGEGGTEEYAEFLEREAGEEIKRVLANGGYGSAEEDIAEEESKKEKKKKKKKEHADGDDADKDAESPKRKKGKGTESKEKEDQDFLMK